VTTANSLGVQAATEYDEPGRTTWVSASYDSAHGNVRKIRFDRDSISMRERASPPTRGSVSRSQDSDVSAFVPCH